jgi:hypothetical protein
MSTFVVTTVYTRPGKPLIVHSWGPYSERRLAANAAGRIRRRHFREDRGWSQEGVLTLHIGQVMDPFEVREWDPDLKLWVMTEYSTDLKPVTAGEDHENVAEEATQA